jgi:hypothetical protein
MNHAAKWMIMSSLAPYSNRNKVTMTAASGTVLLTHGNSNNNDVFTSVNSGSTWTAVCNLPLFAGGYSGAAFYINSNVVLLNGMTATQSVYKSTDSGSKYELVIHVGYWGIVCALPLWNFVAARTATSYNGCIFLAPTSATYPAFYRSDDAGSILVLVIVIGSWYVVWDVLL